MIKFIKAIKAVAKFTGLAILCCLAQKIVDVGAKFPVVGVIANVMILLALGIGGIIFLATIAEGCDHPMKRFAGTKSSRYFWARVLLYPVMIAVGARGVHLLGGPKAGFNFWLFLLVYAMYLRVKSSDKRCYGVEEDGPKSAVYSPTKSYHDVVTQLVFWYLNVVSWFRFVGVTLMVLVAKPSEVPISALIRTLVIIAGAIALVAIKLSDCNRDISLAKMFPADWYERNERARRAYK